MHVKTGRFGEIKLDEADIVTIPGGILGFPKLTEYCLLDPGDDTLILWLQSIQNPQISFPVLEPKIFKTEYMARLSASELRELQLDSVNKAAVYNVLTIPEDVSQMTANMKAPIIINLARKIAKQIVLQENEYQVKHPMFKELKVHLTTIASQQRAASNQSAGTSVVPINDLSPSSFVKILNN